MFLYSEMNESIFFDQLYHSKSTIGKSFYEMTYVKMKYFQMIVFYYGE
jgi:hypothetical protein